jgi:tetratricopeptide (TPR) repeat protein
MTKELIDKILLIYEFDNSSPLFAAVANYYLEQKDIKKALEILIHGLSLYPNYPTGHIIMGKVLTVNGDYDKAKEHFITASKLLNSSETLKFYNTKIESVISNSQKLSQSLNNFLEEDDLFNSVDEDIIDSKKHDPIDDNLEQIALEIQNAKIPPVSTDDAEIEDLNLEFNNKELISEPLASIYFAQGNFKEALEMYNKLISIHPEKEMIYRAKITEIKNILAKNS